MTDNTENELDFEQTLSELETLVAQLETGDLTLEESLAGFKRGIELSRSCQQVLDKAQQTVDQLVNPEDEASATDFKTDD